MNADVIKEYLVSLGFSVNNATYTQFNQTLQSAQKTAEAATSGMARSFVTASATMAAAIGTVTIATGSLLHNLAKADMEYQKLALHMWTSKQNAKDLKTAIDALGESLEDAAFIPELRGQLNSLIGQGRSMAVPGAEYAQQMRDIRSIGFEFKRMKLEATYATEWIGYYLVKHLAGPLAAAKKWLKDLNDSITKFMPIWTEKIASGLASVISVATAVGRLFQNIGEYAGQLWESFPKGVKMMTAAFATMSAFMLASPFGQFLYMLTAALILLEDFFYYIDGRDSSKTLAPMWEWIKKLKEGNLIGFDLNEKLRINKETQESWDRLVTAVNKFKDANKGWFDTLKENFTTAEWYKVWLDGQHRTLTGMLDIITKLAEFLFHWKKGDLLEWIGKGMEDWLRGTQKRVNGDRTTPAQPYGRPPGEDWRDGGASPRGDNRAPSTGGHWQQLADRVSAKTGVPANLIYGQWAHETGGFSHFAAPHNAAGLTQEQPNGYKQPDGRNYYMAFDSDEAFADKYAWWIDEPQFRGITTPEGFARELKGLKYFTDDEARYAAGIRRHMGGYSGGERTSVGGADLSLGGFIPSFSSSGTNITTVNQISVSVPPGTDANGWAAAIAKALEPYQGLAQVRVVQQMREVSGGAGMKADVDPLAEKEISLSLQLRVHRIGANSFLLFIIKPDGSEMYDRVLEAELCIEAGEFTLEALQALPVEHLKDVEPQALLSMRGLLIFTLMSDNSDAPQILPIAKCKLAECLVARGLKEKELTVLLDGATVDGKSIIARVNHYLNSLQGEGTKVNRFIGLAYSRKWLTDPAVQIWWNTVSKAKIHK